MFTSCFQKRKLSSNLEPQIYYTFTQVANLRKSVFSSCPTRFTTRPQVVNDFPENITEGELQLYADNTTAYVIGDNSDDVIIKLNRLFEEICTWCKLNKLTLHTGKSEVMIIQRKQFEGPSLPVKCGDTQID